MGLWSTVLRKRRLPKDRVVAHILDPITGYSNRELRVGKDIAADTVQRLGDSGEVFIVVAYDGGSPSATVRTRAEWLRAQSRQQALERDPDPSVWRTREEVEIS
jgi:hypothetical protein